MTGDRKPRARGIAETYIHIKMVPPGLSKNEIHRYLDRFAPGWAKKQFGESAKVEILIEDGSIKLRLLVGGFALYELISGYGSFRAGIDQAVSDAKTFSEFVIEDFLDHEKISKDEVYRLERRLGVPGKIQRFLKSLDKMDSQDISANEREDLTESLKQEFIEILMLLDVEKDRTLFVENVPDENINPPGVPRPEPIRGAFTLDSGWRRDEKD